MAHILHLHTPRTRRRGAPDDGTPTSVERAYLEVITYLADRGAPVRAAQIARWLRVRPPTVAHTLSRLADKDLLLRAADGTITLTSHGSAVATIIVRRHRLLECWLQAVIGVPWHCVHQEAARLEPVLSPILEARIIDAVGTATVCPHGNPIPGTTAAPVGELQLAHASVGARFTIVRIDEEAGEDAALLEYLAAYHLVPQTEVHIASDPGASIVVLERGHERLSVPSQVASWLWGAL
jgi:DtxR family Mn-dependent transcriptional regulator